MPIMLNRLISIAPMMGATDRHYRMLMRQMTRGTLLYTEMLTTNQILRGKQWRALGYSPLEHPLALQLGGSNAADLAHCARIGEDYGYDEVNLNVGCPSSRAHAGELGVCLLKTPDKVADAVAAMKSVVRIPVTVKTRIGVDDYDSYEHLSRFIEAVTAAGCETFILHARKAWLRGLNPKQNRSVPPLSYETVYRLKRDYPTLKIILNGGIKTVKEIDQHLEHVDGVMIGREAYANPFLLADFDQRYFGQVGMAKDPIEIWERYKPYMERQLKQGVPSSILTRPLQGLFRNQRGAKEWRRYFSTPPSLVEATELGY